jgi:hypothetical protein
MKLQYEHKIISSLLLFIDNELSSKGKAYTNYGSQFYPVRNRFSRTVTQEIPPTDCPDCILTTGWLGSHDNVWGSSWGDAMQGTWRKAEITDFYSGVLNGKPYWISEENWSLMGYGVNQGYLWYGPNISGGWLITAELNSHSSSDPRPRAYANSGDESCPTLATWPTTFGTMESCDNTTPETIETTMAYYTYGSPFKQFVYDTSVGIVQGEKSRKPNVISGVHLDGHYLTPGVSGLASIDYNMGQVHFTEDYPSALGVLPSGDYAVKDFNVYLTNEPENVLLFETQFKINPKVEQSPTGLPPECRTYPAIYIKNLTSKNVGVGFPNAYDTEIEIRSVVLSDSAYNLDACCALLKDTAKRRVAIIDSEDQPFGPLGDAGGSGYDYKAAISNSISPNGWSEENSFSIDEVSVSKRSQNRQDFNKLNTEVFVGFVDFTLKNLRDI